MSKLLETLSNAYRTNADFNDWRDLLSQVIEIEADGDFNVSLVALGTNGWRIEVTPESLHLISSATNLRVSLVELQAAIAFIEYLREIIPLPEDGGFVIPGAGAIDDSAIALDKTWSSSKINTDPRMTNARPPTGAVGGDFTGSTYPNLVLPSIVTASTNFLATVTVDAKGRVTNINPYDPTKEGYQFQHFFTVGDLFNTTGTGSVSGTYTAGTSTHPGILTVNCLPVSGAASFCIQKSSNLGLVLGGALWRWRSLIRIPTLSVAGDVFNLYMGFIDSSGASPPQNGCLFIHDNSRGLWVRNVSGGANTEASAGVSMVAGNWYDLMIEINKAGTSVNYYVNGTLTNTLTTNIPTTTISIGYHSYKASGQPNTSRGVDVDFYSLYWNLN
ncbi:MAG: hypothetical protein ACREPR_16180 [Brasilonema sp.]